MTETSFPEIARDILKRDTFMKVAEQISRLGTCPRKAVGAVLVRDGRAISWGFNGAPPGAPHCEENHHGWKESIEMEFRALGRTSWNVREVAADATILIEERGCLNATHAEANALAFAARQGISTDHAELYVTVSPCATCAALLIAAGIRRVYYLEPYRDETGIRMLHRANVGSVHQKFTGGGINL